MRAEIERRAQEARQAGPQRRRAADLRLEREKLERAMDRLLTAYQEQVLDLDELRARMPGLRARLAETEAALRALEAEAASRSAALRLADTLEGFLAELRERAGSAAVGDRRKVLELLVQEVLVGKETVTIRHSIPVPGTGPGSGGPPPSKTSPNGPNSPSYLLHTRRDLPAVE